MKKYNIQYSKDSKQDLIEIKKYIKYNLQEEKTAEKLVDKLMKCIEGLKNSPEKNSIIQEEFIKKLEIRKMVVDNYIVFYRIKGTNIQIVRIMYGRRNWIDLI